MSRYLNISAYKFVTLDRLDQRRSDLRRKGEAAELKGTVLLSPEGINIFLAGLPDRLRRWVDELRDEPEFADLDVKESFSSDQPFNRLLVKQKKEIIAFGIDGIDPRRQTAPKLSAQELKRWLDEGRGVTLLDVRNDYEVEVGTFDQALPVGVDHFRHFPDAIRRLPEELKEKPVVMFCTGGIRCEKAGPLMQREGFGQIFQLDGGILKYFEECGGQHYRGDCFVFDKRVAVGPDLAESEITQCFACQAILSTEEQQSEHYVVGESCPHCYQPPETRMRQRIAERQKTLKQYADPLPGSTPYDNFRPINVPEKYDRCSLLECMCGLHPHISQTEWRQLFDQGRIRRGSLPVRAGRIVRGGEQYLHHFPHTVEPDVNANIEILWEDEALVAVNKPAPLPMHPCGRFNRNTLTEILQQVYAPEILRPAHRLDANTTGVVVFSRTRSFAQQIQDQFDSGGAEKEYLVVCHGHPVEEQFLCDQPIGRLRGRAGTRIIDPEGLAAETEFRVLERRERTSLLEARPVTGRTNQIRIHLWAMQHPIVGDPVYLADKQLGDIQTLVPSADPMLLHASRLTLTHPVSQERFTIRAAPPAAFQTDKSPASI
ncbi:MAG: sulfurtransferase [Pirellulaceae bacterium]